MLANKISGLPVIDVTGRLVGMLTEGDLLRRVEIGTDAKSLNWIMRLLSLGAQAEAYVHTHARTVGDLMSERPITVEEATPLADVVALMERRGVKRVPVLADGKLVGVVSRSDLLRAVASRLVENVPALDSDLEIRDRVAHELASQPWSAHANITVQVDAGKVTLQGTIFDERSRAAIRVAAENVAGVKSVSDEMVWADPVSGAYFGAA
jgi:CBS domain-containing protein